MAVEPNLAGGLRLLYVAVGIGLMAWGFFGAESDWLRIGIPILGAIVLFEGVIGFCLVRWLLGLGSTTR
jgi:hypothetical protein